MQKNQFNERESLLAKCTALLDLSDAEGRALTQDEQYAYDRDTTKIRALNLELNGGTRRPVSSFGQPSSAISDVPIFDEPQSRIVLSSGPKMRAFQNSAKGREDAYVAGQWLKATLLQDPKANQFCQNRGLQCDVMAAAGTSPNTAGGALVPDLLANRIIDLREEYGLFRQEADVVTMGSTTETFARNTSILTAHFVGENTEGTESDSSWDNVTLTAKKAMCLTRMSSEISDDAIINMADRFTVEIAAAFATLEDTCGFNGTGSQAHGGITGVLVKALQSGNTMAKVAAASGHDTMAEIDADDLLNLMAKIPQYAKKGAAWYCSPSVKTLVIDAIKIAGGGNTASMLAAAQSDGFMGYPVHVTPLMADSPATVYNGAVILGFGNLRQAAMMGSRREIRVALSNDRYFELDQIGVKGTERFDINVCNLGSTTVKSPFAVLTGTT